MRFDGYKVSDMATSDPVPEATYHLRIAKVDYANPDDPEWKAAHPNSEAKHPGLLFDFVVQDEGDLFGRHVFQNATMKKGGDWLLRQIVEALGKEDDWELDTDEMVDGEVMGVVLVKPASADGKYTARNEIKKFLPLL